MKRVNLKNVQPVKILIIENNFEVFQDHKTILEDVFKSQGMKVEISKAMTATQATSELYKNFDLISIGGGMLKPTENNRELVNHLSKYKENFQNIILFQHDNGQPSDLNFVRIKPNKMSKRNYFTKMCNLYKKSMGMAPMAALSF